MFASVLVLAYGETPRSYRTNPGELPGPWPGDAEATIAELVADTGYDVPAGEWEWWERGDTLWIAPLMPPVDD